MPREGDGLFLYWFEWFLGFVYMLLGPVAWGFVIFGVVKGRLRLMLINLPARELPACPPHVTIVIPAKDEGARIADCVNSALAQDYPSFEVIAVNDRSTDNTGSVLDEIASRDPRLKAVHIAEGTLPAGWTGKCNALNNGVKHAKPGSWLLFVDSDVILEPVALRATVAETTARQFDMMTLILRLESHGFWEWLMVPLAAGAVGFMYQIALANSNDWPRVTFANGQFMLFRREVYDAIGGHAPVKDQFCEDMAFARLLKSSGYRPRVSMGIDLAAVRMYSSLSSIIRGWSRIYFASSSGNPTRTVLATLFLILCCFSVYFAIAWGIYRNYHPASIVRGWLWLATAGVHLLFMTVGLGMIYRWTGNPRRAALLFPLGGTVLLWIYIRALIQCFTGKVTWRGTSYGPATAPAPKPEIP